MKRIFFILTSLLLSCSNEGNITSEDLTNNQLKGNVKSVKVSTYEAIEKFDKIVKGKQILGKYETIDITEFDKFGKISTISSYDKQGLFDGKSVYTYKNNHIDQIISYNSNGNMSGKSVHNWENDLLSSIIIYDSKGREGGKTINEYNGNKLKTISIYVFGQLRQKSVVTEYEGNLAKEIISYDRNGKETHRNINDYKNGKLSLSSTANGTYAVNEDGLTIKSIDCYKVLDNYSEEIKGFFIYKYEYDKKGNWIRCIVYRNERPYRIVEREILYR